jgi:hypothetical chaperone protein
MSKLCGIDFGTSNSTIGIIKNNQAQLINIEGNSKTVPSAIFYEDEDMHTVYGKKALDYYQNHYSGRLLRSFKSVLGTSLMDDKTIIRNSKVPFTNIIQDFISHLKNQAENIENVNLDYAVIGRPINFVDNDDAKNTLAQKTLEDIAKKAGFKSVEFQYEPIAASLKYEQSLKNEELVLIIDIGGGTTDISVVNLSPEFIKIDDRSSHCLANCGVHIGGTDFDKHLSLKSFMPLLGYGQNMPKHIYHDIATWHRINNIYTQEFKRSILQHKNKLNSMYFNRLNDVIDEKLASSIAINVEQSKINLSNNDDIAVNLNYIEKGLICNTSKQNLQQAIEHDLLRIGSTIDECLSQANITKNDINSIFLTGGSSQMSLIKIYIQSLFPNTKIDNADSLSSVGTGLVLDAMKKFK